jgi:malate synthase
LAKPIFDEHMLGPNQLHKQRLDDVITAADLISMKGVKGSITEEGIRSNLSVALMYMEAWLCGVGCVPIHNLMEDAATAEISRSQLWQWVRHGAKTDDGKVITKEWMRDLLDDEIKSLRKSMGEAKFVKSRYDQAAKFLLGTIQGGDYSDFLTVSSIY